MLKRISNSKNGEERYIFHSIHLLSELEKFTERVPEKRLQIALKKARAIGGKAYQGKGFNNWIFVSGMRMSVLLENIKNLKEVKFR